MSYRRHRELSLFEHMLAAPWWGQALFAFCCYVGSMVIVLSTRGDPILFGFALVVHMGGDLMALVFGITAVLNFLTWLLKLSIGSPEPDPEPPNPGSWRYAQADAAGPMPAGPAPRARTDVWTLALLRELEWKRFEEVCAAYFRLRGMFAKTADRGPDAGVDIALSDAEGAPVHTIIQCKAWNASQVGVKPIRELQGVRSIQRAHRALFMATGTFTSEAAAFAKTARIHLLDGARILRMFQELPLEKQRKLLEVATEGEYTRPTCPSCGIKMVVRNGQGGSFWGCANYPRGCRVMFPI